MTSDYTPISDMEAEQALLGCWLSDPQGKWFILYAVPAEDFYYDEHVIIAKTIASMVASNQKIDHVTVSSRLAKDDKLERVGGSSYVKKLVAILPSVKNGEYYRSTVLDMAHIRAMTHASQEAFTIGSSPHPDAKAMESVLSTSLASHETASEQTAGEVCSDLLGTMTTNKHGQHVPKSGLHGLDSLLHGFYPSTMYTVAARMSVGKSALLFWVALNAGLQGFPTEIVSVEMKPELVAWRMVSAISGVNAIKYFTGEMTDEEWTKVYKANEKLAGLPIYFCRTKKTVDDVCLALRRAKIVHGIALAGVDYLQMLKDGGHESRTAELDSISNKLKGISEELDIALISIVAANRRSVTEKGGVSISDMRGSDGIAYDTDVAVILNEDADVSGLPEDVRRVTVSVAKNRNGRQGENVIFFDKRCQRFSDEPPKW
jgi:replicative DNA helicase